MVLLNGWQRLWVVACVVLIVPWAMLGTERFPTAHSIEEEHGWELSGYDYDLRCFTDTTRRFPCKAKNAAEVKQAITTSMIQYDDDIKRITWLQTKSVMQFVALWIASCAFIYGLGWTVNWVYRGFRPKRLQP